MRLGEHYEKVLKALEEGAFWIEDIDKSITIDRFGVRGFTIRNNATILANRRATDFSYNISEEAINSLAPSQKKKFYELLNEALSEES
jgi:hypothetical protein